MEKEDKRKSREAQKTNTTAPAADVEPTGADEPTTAEADDDELYRDPTPQVAAHESEHEASAPTSPTTPSSPSKGESKGFKSLLNRFRRRSRHERPGFIGGANLRGTSAHSNHDSAPSSPHVVATDHVDEPRSNRRFSDVSSLSSRGNSPERVPSDHAASGGTEFEEARDEFDEKLAPPPNFTSNDAAKAGRKGSPNRDSKFHEVGI
jgi:hypothetical protein